VLPRDSLAALSAFQVDGPLGSGEPGTNAVPEAHGSAGEEVLLHGFEWREAASMDGAGAMFGDSRQVVGRPIALVTGEPVGRVEPIVLYHKSVTSDLCQDAGCGD